MTYELAKQLKDAGFPLQDWEDNYKCLTIDGKDYLYPTLPELIEACGREFKDLHRNEGGSWWVGGVIDGEYIQLLSLPTPEEAVAKLWLSLKDKLSS